MVELHRNSAYLLRRAALASSSDPSGALDNCPVLIQSCRISSVRKQIFLAPTRSACNVNWQCWQTKSKPWWRRFARLVWPQRGQHWLV